MRRRTTDQVVDQATRDNFKDWEPELLDVKKVNGKTVRETIKEDKYKQRQTGMVMGGPYYAGLKQHFRDDSDPLVALRSRDTSLIVDPALMRAIVAFSKPVPDRGAMQAWLQSSTRKPNQTEVCGILKFLLATKSTCKRQLLVGLDCLRYCARLSLHQDFEDEWLLVQSHADRILGAAFHRAARENNMDAATFVSLHDKLVFLVLPEEETNALLNCTGAWEGAAESLHKVVSQSQLGISMFGFAIGKVLAVSIDKLISAKIALVVDQPWTELSIASLKASILVEIQSMPNIDMLPDARTIEGMSCGMKVTHKTLSVAEEVAWKVALVWKGIAVCQGKIKKLWVEEPLGGEHMGPN